MSGETIVFGDRMRKSYKVFLPATLKFNNARGSHVETDATVANGTVFTLGERRVQFLDRTKDYAVMYDVIGLLNKDVTAHLTVYFGKDEKEAEGY